MSIKVSWNTIAAVAISAFGHQLSNLLAELETSANIPSDIVQRNSDFQ
jgi:hypothetical protein